MFPTGSIRRLENTHILLWLLKDTFWVLNLKIPGLLMVLPTIAVAVFLTFRAREHIKEFFFNLAVLCWICANSTWMIGEFFFEDSLRFPALLFFISGLVSIGAFYVKLLAARLKKTIERD
jgi:hypothetical protein